PPEAIDEYNDDRVGRHFQQSSKKHDNERIVGEFDGSEGESIVDGRHEEKEGPEGQASHSQVRRPHQMPEILESGLHKLQDTIHSNRAQLLVLTSGENLI